MNATVEENILFGKPKNEALYRKAIQTCALNQDIDILPAGDQTEIGEKGINLSGGQKQRVSLARAVYSQADVYIFDDPLSAVDSHVGAHLFDQVIGPKGLLKNKARILVTHGMHFLPKADQIILLKNGEIAEMGTYSELMEQGEELSRLVLEFTNLEKNKDGEKNEEKSPEDEEPAKQPDNVLAPPPEKSIVQLPALSFYYFFK